MATYYLNVKVGKLNMGLPHFNYIFREEKYNVREDLIYTDFGNMPEWAKDDPKIFWEAVQEFEKRTPYKEYVLALPEEFTHSENIKLVDEFIQKQFGDKIPFSYAIHEKKSTLEEGHKNIHAHIMFSERQIEHDRPLNKEQFFKRYSENQRGEITGGYKKDRRFSGSERKKFLYETREFFADLQNKYYKKNGFDIKVSHKTLAEQAEELKKNGEYIKAIEYDRPARNRLPTDMIFNPKMFDKYINFDKTNEAFKRAKRAFFKKAEIKEKVEKIKKSEDILSIHAKDYIAKDTVKLQKILENNLEKIAELKKERVHDNAIKTIIWNKLSNFEYSKIKKELKKLQDRKDYIEERISKKEITYYDLDKKDLYIDEAIEKVNSKRLDIEIEFLENHHPDFIKLKNQIVTKNNVIDEEIKKLTRQNHILNNKILKNESTLKNLNMVEDVSILVRHGRSGGCNINPAKANKFVQNDKNLFEILDNMVNDKTIQIEVKTQKDIEDIKRERREKPDKGMDIGL